MVFWSKGWLQKVLLKVSNWSLGECSSDSYQVLRNTILNEDLNVQPQCVNLNRIYIAFTTFPIGVVPKICWQVFVCFLDFLPPFVLLPNFYSNCRVFIATIFATYPPLLVNIFFECSIRIILTQIWCQIWCDLQSIFTLLLVVYVT